MILQCLVHHFPNISINTSDIGLCLCSDSLESATFFLVIHIERRLFFFNFQLGCSQFVRVIYIYSCTHYGNLSRWCFSSHITGYVLKILDGIRNNKAMRVLLLDFHFQMVLNCSECPLTIFLVSMRHELITVRFRLFLVLLRLLRPLLSFSMTLTYHLQIRDNQALYHGLFRVNVGESVFPAAGWSNKEHCRSQFNNHRSTLLLQSAMVCL